MDAQAHWDAARLVKDLGGPAFVRANLLKYGLLVPSRQTIHNWIRRNRLPGDAAAALLVLGRSLAPKFDPFDYLLVEDENGERPCRTD